MPVLTPAPTLHGLDPLYDDKPMEFHGFFSNVRCTHLHPVPTPRVHRVAPHLHRFLELVLVREGRGAMQHDGVSHGLGPGDLLVVRPFAVHAFVYRGPFDLRILSLDLSALARFFKGSAEEEALVGFLEGLRRARAVLRTTEEHSLLMERLGRGDRITDLGRSLALIGLLCAGARALPRPFALSRFHRLVAHLETHFDDELPLAKAASLCGLSRFHFSREFSRVFGMGFVEYLTRHRLSHTTRLLRHTRLRVGELALASGFGSFTRFNRAFRGAFGMTPLAYRERFAKIDQGSAKKA